MEVHLESALADPGAERTSLPEKSGTRDGSGEGETALTALTIHCSTDNMPQFRFSPSKKIPASALSVTQKFECSMLHWTNIHMVDNVTRASLHITNLSLITDLSQICLETPIGWINISNFHNRLSL